MPEKVLATDGPTIEALLRRRQLDDFAASKFSEDLDADPNIDPDKATVWVCTKDFTFSGGGSGGPLPYRRGQRVTYPPMITQLRLANAAIVPVR